MPVQRLGVAAIVVVLWVCSFAQSATAHSALLRSEPRPGETLEHPPEAVLLEFSERPDPSLSGVEVLDAAGEPVPGVHVSALAGDAETLRAELPPLPAGVYTVNWRALSAIDGHLTTGAFSFGVGVAPPTAQAFTTTRHDSARPSALAVAGRWTLYWGLALLLGAALTGLYVFDDVLGRRLGLVACWGVTLTGLTMVVAAEASSAGVTLGRLLTSAAGDRHLRVAVIVAAAGIAVALAVARRHRWPLAAVAVASVAAMVAHAASGHANAQGSNRWLAIGTQGVHIVAVGAWIGGLVWLLVGTQRRRGEIDRSSAVNRFSRMATVAFGLIVLTGVVRAIQGLDAIESLWNSSYGRTLLLKLALIGPLLLLAAINRFRLMPAAGRDRQRLPSLRRAVGGEIMLAGGVFGLTAVLAGLPPPADTTTHDIDAPSLTATGTDFGNVIRIRLAITPGTVGPNRFEVRVEDYDSGEPVVADRVTLNLTLPDRPRLGPASLRLDEIAPGRWAADGPALSIAGDWRVAVLIEAPPEAWDIPLDVTIDPASHSADGHATDETGHDP